MKLSVKPHSHTAMNAAITEVGRLNRGDRASSAMS